MTESASIHRATTRADAVSLGNPLRDGSCHRSFAEEPRGNPATGLEGFALARWRSAFQREGKGVAIWANLSPQPLLPMLPMAL